MKKFRYGRFLAGGLVGAWFCALVAMPVLGPDAFDTAFESIQESEVTQHLKFLASPDMEGRDTPSVGLLKAGEYLAEQFRESGLEPLEAGGGYTWPFDVDSSVPREEACMLTLVTGQGEQTFVLGEDFAPLRGMDGLGEGKVAFVGFGISSSKDKYNDLRGLSLKGTVAVILEGEPRHPKRFGGEEVTDFSDIYSKIERLSDRGVTGVLVARRNDAEGIFGFRHGWARWVGERSPQHRPPELPVHEIRLSVASVLVGQDLEKIAAELDESLKPQSFVLDDHHVVMESATDPGRVTVNNIIGVIPGTDPGLQDEWVVVGAHYDHVGVDERGRIGFGADDNASGTAAVLEIAEALAMAETSRSIMVCAFAGEERDLMGSRALCRNLPVDRDQVVAMVNLDMVGRGDRDEVTALGSRQNPGMKKILDRARKLRKTGIKKVITGKAEDLFLRSDQFSFHEIGIPAVFFFEDPEINRNTDYHTWRDTVDEVDMAKVTQTARLAFNAVWILATDEKRQPPPRH